MWLRDLGCGAAVKYLTAVLIPLLAGGGGGGFADHGSEKPSLAQTVAAHGHNPLWLRLVLAEIAFLFPFESSS